MENEFVWLSLCIRAHCSRDVHECVALQIFDVTEQDESIAVEQ